MDTERNGFENPYGEGEYTRFEASGGRRSPARILVHWHPDRDHEYVLMFNSDVERDEAMRALSARWAPAGTSGSFVFERDDVTVTPDMLAGDLPEDVFVGFRPASPESAWAMLRLGFDAGAHRIPDRDGFVMMMPDVLRQLAEPLDAPETPRP